MRDERWWYLAFFLLGSAIGAGSSWVTAPGYPAIVRCEPAMVNVPKCEFPRIDLTIYGVKLKDIGGKK